MDNQWYLNKMMWAGIMGFVSFILAKYGYTVTSEQGTQIVDFIMAAAQAISGLVAIILVIWDKIKSRKEIKTLRLEVKKLARP